MFSDPRSQGDGEKGRSRAWWEGRDSWRNKNPLGKEFADSRGLWFMFLEPFLEHHHLGKKWGSQENVLASGRCSSRDPGYVKMTWLWLLVLLPPSGQGILPFPHHPLQSMGHHSSYRWGTQSLSEEVTHLQPRSSSNPSLLVQCLSHDPRHD